MASKPIRVPGSDGPGELPRSRNIMMPQRKPTKGSKKLWNLSSSVPCRPSSSSSIPLSSQRWSPPSLASQRFFPRSPTALSPVHKFHRSPTGLSPTASPRVSFSNLSDACLELSLGSSLMSHTASPHTTPSSPHTTPSLSPFSITEELPFEGLDLSAEPTNEVVGPVEEGVGGTYLVRGLAQNGCPGLKVFKPTHEEGSDPNATGGRKVALKRGVVYGETTLKEVAAYKLDHGRWAGVPHTELSSVTMEAGLVARGSLQAFQSHVCSCEDIGTSRFSVSPVHRIGVLDIRLLNLDRHMGNILVTSDDKLVPIDHGYVLPSWDDMADISFEWLYWKQCKKPFEPNTLAYVEALDPHNDCCMLRSLGLREDSLLAQFCATVFLQRAVRNGLTLFEIGSMVQRIDDESESVLEMLMKDLMAEIPVLHGMTFDESDEFFSVLCARVDGVMTSTLISA